MKTTTRIAVWVLVAAIVALTIVPPGWRPVTGVPRNFEHFLIFLLAGGAFALAYSCNAYILAAAALVFCGTLELSQTLVPGRHARLTDLIVDTSGALVGIAVVVLIRVRVAAQD